MTDIAIVGGGVAGLYLARRLQDMEIESTVYEKGVRLGGRINTCHIQYKCKDAHSGDYIPEAKLLAELGAMRIPDRHRLMKSLLRHCGLMDLRGDNLRQKFQEYPFNLPTLFYLRGKLLSELDFKIGQIPYRLRPEEQGKLPSEVVEYAILKALKKVEPKAAIANLVEDIERRKPIDAERWIELSREGKCLNFRLCDIGFWNLLKHFLSSEAFLLSQDGLGFASVISNWNSTEAFKWLISDFPPDGHFLNSKGGFDRLLKALSGREDLKESEREKSEEGLLDSRRLSDRQLGIKFGENLREVQRQGNKFNLFFGEGRDQSEWVSKSADIVVLAMPTRALSSIKLTDASRKERNSDNWEKLLHSSRPHRLEKIVLLYKEPWWKYTGIPGGESGRVFTDLPMRQIYYFGPSWLRENGFVKAIGRDVENLSMLMVYNDSYFEGFWRTFSVHQEVYCGGRRVGDEGKEKKLEEWEEEILGPFPFDLLDDRVKALVDVDTDCGVPVRHRMEEKIRSQLKEIHNFSVPRALGGVYKDWSEEGGWHTWEPFVSVDEAKQVVVQPFKEDFVLADPKTERADRIPLYTCGESFAWEQGWIEGALMTAEALVKELSAREGVTFKVPEWFEPKDEAGNKRMPEDIEKLLAEYMKPELDVCPTKK